MDLAEEKGRIYAQAEHAIWNKIQRLLRTLIKEVAASQRTWKARQEAITISDSSDDDGTDGDGNDDENGKSARNAVAGPSTTR